MERITDILLTIRRMGKLHERCLAPICAKYQLSQMEATIISFLHNNPGLDTAGDISELRMLPKGNISQGVEVLVQRALLARCQDRADRRRIHLTLQPAAQPLIQEMEEANDRFVTQLFAGFSAEERAVFQALNERIMQNTIRGLEGK